MISDLDKLAIADPRGRREEEWLDVLEHLLASLKTATRAEIEVGPYWFDVGSTAESASLGARIRADGPLLWSTSDCWEASFCITGNSKGAYVDVFAFPFLRGSVVTRDGRLADLEGDREVEEFWLQLEDRKWEVRGWHYPEGTGEWDHVRRPGDACFRAIRCTAVKPSFAATEPLMVTVDSAQGSEPSLGDHASLSIHRLLRDGHEIVAAPSAVTLHRPGSPRRLPFGSNKLPAEFRLDTLPIPGGWVPGEYQLEVRLHHTRGSTSRDADISEATTFEVVGG